MYLFCSPYDVFQLSVDLSGYKTSSLGLFVVGGLSVPEADLKFTDTRVYSKMKIDGEPGFQDNFIDDGDSSPIGIGLLYYRGSFPELRLTVEKPSIQLRKFKNKQFINRLNHYLVDLIVFARKSQNHRCSIFETLYNPWVPTIPMSGQGQYQLRLFQPKHGSASINRCTISAEAFIPKDFLLGPQSPNRPNICTSDLKAYNLLDQFPDEVFETSMEVEASSSEYCTGDDTEMALVSSLDEDQVGNYVQES